jgi:transcriptional regulator with XRE-family HTH domain/predicted transcriptional regulator
MDPLVLGRRIRHIRTGRGMTLEQLGSAINRAPSRISAIENGHRAPSLSQLHAIAETLAVSVRGLLQPTAPTRRDELEIEWERIQRSPRYAALGLPQVRLGKALSNEALEALVGLHAELNRVRLERVATPEEARRANAELRGQMRDQDDYFPDLEAMARKLLDLVPRSSGPMSHTDARALAARLGFTLHFAGDLPHSTRSVLDLKNFRIYLPKQASQVTGDHRSALLQSLASYVLGHEEPADYAEFLKQRVEANYLAAALMMPERDAVPLLKAAKAQREVSIEDFRDAFTVSYEMAAHRFTNLATRHLEVRVHFMKVHSSGVIHKAYENDGVLFPMDPLGAIEGQYVCRSWTARAVFESHVGAADYTQYTDTPTGTFWCTSHLKHTRDGRFSVSVGARYEDSKWFRGRVTTNRRVSRCPDPACCQLPPADLARDWDGRAWPTARPHSSVLAAMPAGAFPGVDTTDVYEFLERHSR